MAKAEERLPMSVSKTKKTQHITVLDPYRDNELSYLERMTGLEPATFSLGS